MPATDTSVLPLLPLSSGVVLPGMVVTLALETPEAQAAASAAESADRTLVHVPRRPGGGYADVGTVARIVEAVGATPSDVVCEIGPGPATASQPNRRPCFAGPSTSAIRMSIRSTWSRSSC